MNDEKPVIELLPPLSGRCKLIVTALRASFTLVPILLALWGGAEFGWLYAFFIWIGAVFAGLIILSKLKTSYVPPTQHELSHSATAIIKWFAAYRLCEPKREEPHGRSETQ